MKRTSSFIMAVALLLTMLVPMLAIGVAAEAPAGAVAYYEKDGQTYYVNSLAEALTVGATAGNGVDTVNFIANKTVTLTSAAPIVVDAAKSFTLNGNNCNITEDGSFTSGVIMKIMGTSADTTVTLDGFNIKFGNASKNVHALEVGDNTNDKPVTVVLKNTKIDENRKSYATVVVRKSAKLVLDEGSSITNNFDKNLWNSGPSFGIFMTGSGALEVRTGATVSGYEKVIEATDATASASTVTINGGSVTASAGIAINSKGNVVVNSGSVVSNANNTGAAIATTKSVVVNGGTIQGDCAISLDGGTANITNGTFITNNLTCLVVKSGTTATVSGGVFKTANADVVSRYSGWGVVTVQAGGTLNMSNGSITSDKVGSGTALVSAGTTVITGGTIKGNAALDVNGGTTTVNGGKFIATGLTCAVANSGATMIINGGSFTTSSSDLVLQYTWGLVCARNGNVTVNGGEFYYPAVRNNADAHVLKKLENGVLALNGGTFYDCAEKIYNGDASGHSFVRFASPASNDGASVRTAKDTSGIRFTSVIPADAINKANGLKKQGTEIVYGTVIAPYDYVQQVSLFTMASLDAADIKVGGVSVPKNKKYVNIVADEGVITDADGNVTIRAALVNIQDNNLARDFAAIPYISYQTEGGTVIVYGAFDSEKNVRNVREIAYEALKDVKMSADTEYGTLVTSWYEYSTTDGWVEKTGTAYSCYSVAQLDVIKAYLPKN